ncbi:3-keto-disaccharide hydrolase [Tundrisphaera sp. TA3]|uniref:3-keto-disaccharide hydrolase n=1 Tax=Tundrisphaera sp. TA3 TaxID=3435775 RepID=UPI003EB9D57C
MRRPSRNLALMFGLSLLAWSAPLRAGDGWVDLSTLDAWKEPTAGWSIVGGVKLDPSDAKKLVAEPGSAVMYNGPDFKKSKNIVSKESFGDVEIHAEFVVPKGSNSGIKFQTVYEVQIFDSYGAKKPTGTDSGSVYPRSEMKPKYHKIDEGHPPLVIASRPPGEWQEMDLTFKAPRFDDKGNKTASARISVKLNGQVVQDNLEVTSPTGNNWRNKEKPTGPILIQSDHGPVAFRNLRARHLDAKP